MEIFNNILLGVVITITVIAIIIATVAIDKNGTYM